jgi:hypothetical protein
MNAPTRRLQTTSSPHQASAEAFRTSDYASSGTRKYAGALIAYGFIIISAASNFLFAFSLARTLYLALVYGAVGVLTTLANAYIPLRMLDAYDSNRKSVIVAGSCLLPFCIAFSLASAFGFAASVRDHGTSDQAALGANYKTTIAQLKDAESAQKPNAKRIEELRNEIKTYRLKGAMKSEDAQATALEALGIPDGRYYISLLFALLVEVGAALGLFIAFADTHSPTIPRSRE